MQVTDAHEMHTPNIVLNFYRGIRNSDPEMNEVSLSDLHKFLRAIAAI